MKKIELACGYSKTRQKRWGLQPASVTIVDDDVYEWASKFKWRVGLEKIAEQALL